MCYSALVKKDIKALAKTFGAISVRQQIDDYDYKSNKDPKLYPPLSARIYPGNYAPIIHLDSNDQKTVSLMRYSANAPSYIQDPRGVTTYNARRDNLTSKFWSESFMKNHGFIVLEAFYEWVEVKDLLRAGVVTLQEVTEEFEKQKLARKQKIEEQGKKYKPTPTETKDPRFRKIIIEFKSNQDLFVPVIYSVTTERVGFAIVTDDPLPEVEAAGHDRTPIFLAQTEIEQWLRPQEHTAEEMLKLLQKRAPGQKFDHALPKVA